MSRFFRAVLICILVIFGFDLTGEAFQNSKLPNSDASIIEIQFSSDTSRDNCRDSCAELCFSSYCHYFISIRSDFFVQTLTSKFDSIFDVLFQNQFIDNLYRPPIPV